MKINWKIVVAVGVLIAAIILGISSLRPALHNGSDLNIAVGNGSVTITNPSDLSLPAKLVGRSSFTVSSSIEDVSGRSTLQGSGNNTTQELVFMVPPGVSEFTVVRGAEVSFVAVTDTPLEVAVQPFNTTDTRIRLIVTVIAILGSLFYLSSSNDHRWISAARRKKSVDQAAAQETERQNFQRILDGRNSNKS